MKILSTTIEDEHWETIQQNAEKAWINGKSNIRTKEREEFGPEDQLVGQMGEYALAKYFGVLPSYFSRREEINKNPWKGDGGSDIPGQPVDVKTSLMRRQKDPSRYNLIVRPKERHEDNIYVLALVPSIEDRKVLLVGWAGDRDLGDPMEFGMFRGAHVLPAPSLFYLQNLGLYVTG